MNELSRPKALRTFVHPPVIEGPNGWMPDRTATYAEIVNVTIENYRYAIMSLTGDEAAQLGRSRVDLTGRRPDPPQDLGHREGDHPAEPLSTVTPRHRYRRVPVDAQPSQLRFVCVWRNCSASKEIPCSGISRGSPLSRRSFQSH